MTSLSIRRGALALLGALMCASCSSTSGTNEADAGITCEPSGIADAVKSVLNASTAQRSQWGANGRAFIDRERSRELLAADLLVALERAVETR